MIWKFFKEYIAWYAIYIGLSLLYFLTFYLYHLPLAYFKASFYLNFCLLILVSLWKFQQFRKKMAALRNGIYIEELNELHLPSDLAYRDLLTKQKEAEAELLLTQKSQIEDLQSMIKMWTHQMKVPISALSLMSQTDHLNKRDVRQQLLRLENYLDTLLTYLKFNQNKDDFRFEECSMRDLVADLVKKYRISFLIKQMSVDIDGDWYLKTDKKWLSFAISQILDNAIKYSKKNSVIQVNISQGQISIIDHGIGILEEDLPRLFEEGFTGYNGHEHQKATGFGLYMTKQVLDRLGFVISISSQVDHGTTVLIKR